MKVHDLRKKQDIVFVNFTFAVAAEQVDRLIEIVDLSTRDVYPSLITNEGLELPRADVMEAQSNTRFTRR